MDTRDIGLFIKVAETGSLTTAAKSEFMSQSVVSYTMKKIEKELDATLLHRTTHGIELTEAGQHFYDCVTTIKPIWESAFKEIWRLEHPDETAFRIGLIGHQVNGILMKPAGAFASEMETMQVELIDLPSSKVVESLLSGSVDAAFALSPFFRSTDEIVQYSLGVLRPYLMVSRTHHLAERRSVAPSDLLGEKAVSIPPSMQDDFSRSVNDYFRNALQDAEGLVEKYVKTADFSSCKTLVRTGEIVSFAIGLPSILDDVLDDGITYVPIDIDASAELCLLCRKEHRTPLIDRFVAIARKQFA